jgi:hypothetical protein
VISIQQHRSFTILSLDSTLTRLNSHSTSLNPPSKQTNMKTTPRVLSQVLRSIKRSKLVEEAHPFFIYPAKQAAYPTSTKFFAQRLGRTARM